MASNGCSVIEVGAMHHPRQSTWRIAGAAVAGGACALWLLSTVGVDQAVQQWATTSNVVSGSVASTASRFPTPMRNAGFSLPQMSELRAFPTGMTDSSYSTTDSTSQAWKPVLLAASGILVLLAAAVRLMSPRRTSGPAEYGMLLTTAVQHRVERERREKEQAERAQREIQERLLRLASMGAASPVTKQQVVVQSSGSVASEWEVRQQMREKLEREQAQAKQQEIQERLARLSRLGAATPQVQNTSQTGPVGAATEWEKRQQEREQRERQQAEAKQREIQERLARLATLGAVQPQQATSPTSHAGKAAASEWEKRQQEREQRERAVAAAKQQEIQERLARLAQLGAAAPPKSQATSSPVVNDWERRQQERERSEQAKAEAARREIQERMARLARLSSGSA